MIINNNGMTYDSSDKRCKLIIANTGATQGLGNVQIAFISVVDDSTQTVKDYFGFWDSENREASILNIMDFGGSWPAI